MKEKYSKLSENEIAALKCESKAADEKFKNKAKDMIAELDQLLDRSITVEDKRVAFKPWFDQYASLLCDWIFTKLKYDPVYRVKGDFALAETLIPCIRDVFEKEPLQSLEAQKEIKRINIAAVRKLKGDNIFPPIDADKIADQIERFVVVKSRKKTA
jgi:hypothetical protein